LVIGKTLINLGDPQIKLRVKWMRCARLCFGVTFVIACSLVLARSHVF
jgi:hypothetical protein